MTGAAVGCEAGRLGRIGGGIVIVVIDLSKECARSATAERRRRRDAPRKENAAGFGRSGSKPATHGKKWRELLRGRTGIPSFSIDRLEKEAGTSQLSGVLQLLPQFVHAPSEATNIRLNLTGVRSMQSSGIRDSMECDDTVVTAESRFPVLTQRLQVIVIDLLLLLNAGGLAVG